MDAGASRILGPVSTDQVFEGSGVSIQLAASGSDTDGALSSFLHSVQRGFAGAPPHWHRELTDTLYVIEGQLLLRIDGEEMTARPADLVVVPPRTVHGFQVAEHGPARFLLHVAPGGFEGYFDALTSMIEGSPSWPPENLDPVLELMAQWDTFTPPVEPEPDA